MNITRVSVDSAGNQSNPGLYFFSSPFISPDGRFVAFRSNASDLVVGETKETDIFVRDTLTNTTTRVSLDPAGTQGNNDLFSRSISTDGRFVAFSSYANNLVAGDTNDTPDIFVRDTLTNTITRVSVDSAGNQGNSTLFSVGRLSFSGSSSPSISADGRVVAFVSYATNLVPGDTNDNPDIFVRDTLTNTTTRVSVDSAGNQAFGPPSYSSYPSISYDGRFVAFISNAPNLVPGDTNDSDDIFLRDTLTNTTTRVSVDSAGNQGNNASGNPSISADGRFVAFNSGASNIVPGDTNNNNDIFVRDTLTNTTTLVSSDSAGKQGNNASGLTSISADGRFVAFNSYASNLVPGDTNTGRDIFVRDTLTNTTTLVSLDSAGNQRNIDFIYLSISPDGRFVAFDSYSNVALGEIYNTFDIFVRDTLTNSTTNVSVDSAGNPGEAVTSSISADGRFVAFDSSSSYFLPRDTNNTAN